MKMTDADERALAAIEDAIRTSSYGAFAPGRTALIEARDHIRARLAADQQKGGGEVVGYLVEKKPHVVNDVAQREFYFADEQNPSDPDWWIKGEMQKYTVRPLVYGDTPQPSIPAHAQQCWSCGETYTPEQRSAADGNCPACGVEIELFAQQDGKASGREVVITADEREWLEYAIDHMRDDSEPEDLTCAEALEGLLNRANPPHADQETQS